MKSNTERRTPVLAFINRRIIARRSICHTIIVAFLAQAFVSCSGGRFLAFNKGHKYSYSYKMVQPQESDGLSYQDEYIKIHFDFDDAALRFRLENVSPSLMTIRWNRVSLGVDHRFSVVRHSLDFYSDSSRVNVSALIPPAGYVLETVIPAENVRFEAGRWIERDLFTTTDRGDTTIAQEIAGNVGKPITLMLRLQFGDSLKEYQFGFEVSAVKQIEWSDYRPSRQHPPIVKNNEMSAGDEVTAGIIIVGLLGFIAFLISLPKTPVAE